MRPQGRIRAAAAAASCPENLLDFLDHDAANGALPEMPAALHARDKMPAGQDHRVDPLHGSDGCAAIFFNC